MRGVVVCDPDINYIQGGANEFDFIVIGSDGIFDKLKNENALVDVIRFFFNLLT